MRRKQRAWTKVDPADAVPLTFQMPTNPPWEYRPEAPYHVIACDLTGMPLQTHEFEDPWEAMAWWARFHIGPIEGRTATVCDKHLQFLVGYMAEQNEVTWFGCATGYSVLAQVFPEKPEVHLWEASARGVLPNDAPLEAP